MAPDKSWQLASHIGTGWPVSARAATSVVPRWIEGPQRPTYDGTIHAILLLLTRYGRPSFAAAPCTHHRHSNGVAVNFRGCNSSMVAAVYDGWPRLGSRLAWGLASPRLRLLASVLPDNSIRRLLRGVTHYLWWRLRTKTKARCRAVGMLNDYAFM